ncbi:hypothetical protein B0H19DRAFT_1068746 [Mycena capillaripes]|nr:hypothetical protein B0H19DRAFT_1068746 [Mycena capillaripes]
MCCPCAVRPQTILQITTYSILPSSFLTTTTTIVNKPQRQKRVKMSLNRANPSKHIPGDTSFLDSLPAWELMAFWNHIYNPGYITSNANRFFDHEWLDVPFVKIFVAENVSSTPLSGTRLWPLGSAGDQTLQLCTSLATQCGSWTSAGLMFSLFEIFLLRTVPPSPITSQPSVSSDPVRVKIEPPHASESITLAISIKSEPPSAHLSSTPGAIQNTRISRMWPMLPPVRPDSPSEASVAADDTCAPSTSAANKKRRQPQEIDLFNILESNSVRSRSPSGGAEVTSERPIGRPREWGEEGAN